MQKPLTTVAIIALLSAGPVFAQDAATDPAATDPAVTDPVVTEPSVDVVPDVAVTDDAVVTTAPGESLSPTIVVPEGYVLADLTTFTAEQLIGTDIYDVDDNNVTSISDIEFGADNAITNVIADIGGFLGIGSRSVALSPEQIHIYSDADGNLRAYVNLTREALEALPEYTPPGG